MLLDHTDDQAALLATVSTMLSRARGTALDGTRSSFDTGLDSDLQTSGIFDVASYPDFGLSTAALIVQEICRSAAIVEVAASSIIRPSLCPDAPRPLAVVPGDPAKAIRFLPAARSVLFLSDGAASWCSISPDDIEVVDSYFAYPMGRLRSPEACLARAETCADPALGQRLASLALAAEITGVLQGGLDSVVAHVADRRQFGRPLGSFQAVQHRLAACSVRITAAKWLTLKAGNGNARDIATAAAYAQDSVDRVVNDLHQFMGAMGLTLEHPLHRWTYRARLLKSDLGGASRHYRELVDLAWG